LHDVDLAAEFRRMTDDPQRTLIADLDDRT
jgi:hypothetical protein